MLHSHNCIAVCVLVLATDWTQLPSAPLLTPAAAWLPAGDTRETPAIDVCRGLIKDGAKVCIWDPKVTSMQIFTDLSTPKFEWDRPRGWNKSESAIMQSVEVGGWAGAVAVAGNVLAC